MPSWFLLLLPALLLSFTVSGDGNDWVNVHYVLDQASAPDSTTHLAVSSILHGADKLSAKAPWSVTNEKGFLPPSKDPRDYLSWAPYHWPDCRWCSKAGRAQLAHTSNTSTATATQSGSPGDEDPYEESIDFTKRSAHLGNHRRMVKIHRPRFQTIAISIPLVIGGTTTTSSGSTVTSKAVITHPPAQAAAKTTKTTCTSSPTTSLAPSATWTTCHYVGRDGQVNPDVRSLNGPAAINSVSQYVLYACLASAVDTTSKHSRGAVNAIDTFFLSSSTGLNPNVKFGQVVRGPGPGGASGTFTGILDLRGLVKIVNGILVLKALGHSDWTSTRDLAMRSWLSQYGDWLTQSAIGKMTASRPNNHATFYVSQLVAAKLFQGSNEEAISILVQFFNKQFSDQIAASGEQPFEAVRTRPYHYRCFNIEALITNAKLGDALGLDLWSSRSKYGATIQTAMDFVLASDPKGENVQEAIPHVAAVAAAYGDPSGRYSAFLKKNMKDYQSKPFWFYDQPKAFRRDSSKKAIKREMGAKIPFTCPDVFKDATRVEIDNGLFVTCEELRPLYEADVPEI